MAADSSQAELPPQTNGYSNDCEREDDIERAKMRPVDIDADVREMERRKRVELIMGSKLFREELERIIETQLRDGIGPSGLLQQISDMVGISKQAGNVFKSSSSCVIPINDIRGVEAMGYAKGEKILRCKLACLFRLIDLLGWSQNSGTLITARLNQDDEQFLVNPYGMLFHEITASSFVKVDVRGTVVEQGTTNFSVNVTAFSLHAAVHSARPDIKCIIHVHTPAVIAVSSLKQGLMPLSKEAVVVGDVSCHTYLGGQLDPEEKDKLARNLGPNNKVLLLTNQGALCLGETIEEAFFNARNTVLASESQLKLLPMGLENLVMISDESKKKMFDAAHKPPESTPRPDQPSILEEKVERKWRVGGVEFEALMRMLDNAGFRTGYIYRHPLIKGDPPKPKNDVEVPPAVSSLGYLLEEEELYRQGLWRKMEGGKKGNDRSRWLNSPNTYQKVEILETGTPDPKKITKWIADGSPSHSSTPVKIDSALQFVPKGTNPKEFKQKQQMIKDYRRADKLSAGPQSHILEGVTWEEAKKMQDAAATHAGDQVVLMGAASKGIIQRGHQHNAAVYKSAYAKNPFDCVTDEELDEYKKVVEKKTRGEYDTDFSESEGLSSAAMNKQMDDLHIRSPTSITSETEEESRDEPQILRIETKTAPRPSQPEVVLSDGYSNSFYRTYSHAGLPKGSYLVPNPLHFHIVQEKHIAVYRPSLISIVCKNNTARNCYRNVCYNTFTNCTVNVNDKNTHSVSLDIPFETVKAFIIPFAGALNLIDVSQQNQSSQTKYMQESKKNKIVYKAVQTNFQKELLVESRSLDSFGEKENSEKEMLSAIYADIIAYNSSDGSEIEESKRRISNNDVIDFSEFDQDSNEGIAELTDEIAEILSTASENSIKSTKSSNYYNECKLRMSKQITSEDLNIEIKSKNLEDLNTCQCFRDAISESSNFDKDINTWLVSINAYLSKNSLNYVHESIKEMSQLIFRYLVLQSFELKELILFPELICDENFIQLIADLELTYKWHYPKRLSSEQKNDIRMKIASEVLKMLEINEMMNTPSDSTTSNTISDKIFSISEFLNDILDHFFNELQNRLQFPQSSNCNNFETVSFQTPETIRKDHFSNEIQNNVQFSQSSNCNNFETVSFPTPERKQKDHFFNDQPSSAQFSQSSNGNTFRTEELEVTMFDKTPNSKTGTRALWVAVTNSPFRNVNNQKNHEDPAKEIAEFSNNNHIIINENEHQQNSKTKMHKEHVKSSSNKTTSENIYPRPTSSSNKMSCENICPRSEQIVSVPRRLSPILEEPRMNLYGSQVSDKYLVDLLNTRGNGCIVKDSDKAEIRSVFSNNVNSVNMRLEKPDVTVVACTSVTFFRPKTFSTTAYSKTNSANLYTSENKENISLDDSGDWMGFETAQF